MSGPATESEPRSARLLAFAALYVVWGSTYLAMRIAVQQIPPFLGASARFLIAGAIPYLVLRLRGARAPSAREWRHAAVSGLCLFCGGNGLVMWIEERVPSGLTALVIATSPIWFALFDWLRPEGTRPSVRTWLGIALGTLGVALLADPASSVAGAVPVAPLLTLLFGCMTWVGGSLYGKHHPHHPSVWLHAAQNMLCGGSALLVLGLCTGELEALERAVATPEVVAAFAYLVVFGSWLGFGAYAWLLPRVSPAKLATYAYVNPLIALGLGAAVLHEPVTPRTALSAAVILLAVAVVQGARH